MVVIPLTPALRRQRQDCGCEFEVYTVIWQKQKKFGLLLPSLIEIRWRTLRQQPEESCFLEKNRFWLKSKSCGDLSLKAVLASSLRTSCKFLIYKVVVDNISRLGDGKASVSPELRAGCCFIFQCKALAFQCFFMVYSVCVFVCMRAYALVCKIHFSFHLVGLGD